MMPQNLELHCVRIGVHLCVCAYQFDIVLRPKECEHGLEVLLDVT